MSATADSSLLGKAFDWIKARAIRDHELAAMSKDDLRYLAADIGVAESDLCGILPSMTDNSVLMDQMMRARGLDPAAVRSAFPALAHDMEAACGHCREAKTCRRALRDGSAEVRAHEFCVNAETMDDISFRRP